MWGNESLVVCCELPNAMYLNLNLDAAHLIGIWPGHLVGANSESSDLEQLTQRVERSPLTFSLSTTSYSSSGVQSSPLRLSERCHVLQVDHLLEGY